MHEIAEPTDWRPKRRSDSPRFTVFFVGGNRVCWKTQKPRGEPDPTSVVRICLLHDEGLKTGGTSGPRIHDTHAVALGFVMIHHQSSTPSSTLDAQLLTSRLSLSLSLSLSLALALALALACRCRCRCQLFRSSTLQAFKPRSMAAIGNQSSQRSMRTGLASVILPTTSSS